MHDNRIAAGRGFRCDPRFGPARQDQQAALRPGLSKRGAHEVSSSFSSTISPETACDTVITVLRSRYSTGARSSSSGGSWPVLPQVRISIELPHLAISSPTQVAVSGVPQVERGNLVKPARPVEGGSALIGDRLVVDEAVDAGRADGLLVEAHRVNIAAFDARDLRADQRGAVLEVLRAVVGPLLELAVVAGQGLRYRVLSGVDVASQSAASTSAA